MPDTQSNQNNVETVRSETYGDLHFEIRVSLAQGIIFMLTKPDNQPLWLVGMEPAEAHALSEALQAGVQAYMRLKQGAQPKEGVPCQ